MISDTWPVLFGRDAVMQQLQDALEHEHLVMLTGGPGVGKSALARAYVHAADLPVEQVCWVRLAGVTHISQALQRIQDALTSSRPSQAQTTTSELLSILRTCPRLLLILDGAEDVLDDLVDAWETWWTGREPGSLRVLVTTRQDPHVLSARMIVVSPLGLEPAPHEVCSPAAACFFHCATRRGWTLDVQDAMTRQEVNAIVKHLSGVPIAIELAAARGKLMGLPGLRTYLAQDLSILEARLCDVSSRQRNFTDMLHHTWTQLGEEARYTLLLCSAFHLPFRLEEFAKLADIPLVETLARVEALVGAGVLLATPRQAHVVFDVISVMRRFVCARDEYKALPDELLIHARSLSVASAQELFQGDDASQEERSPSLFDAMLRLAEQSSPRDAAMLLTLIFRHAQSPQHMSLAYQFLQCHPEAAQSSDLLIYAERFYQLYKNLEPSHQRTRHDVNLSGLDPFDARAADPCGARLHRARLLMQAARFEDAELLINELYRQWGPRREGVRARQLDLLRLESLIRKKQFQEARQLARTQCRAIRTNPGEPLWDAFIAATLLLELLGALDQQTFRAPRLMMVWRACGLDVTRSTWWPTLTPNGHLMAMSTLLEWTGAAFPKSKALNSPASAEPSFVRQSQLVSLLVLILRAREHDAPIEVKTLYPFIGAWKQTQYDSVTWFELLVVDIIHKCLRHEKLHSVASQLQHGGVRVTIDMRSSRFRVADASWVSFGHRPKAKLLIERMTQCDAQGDFISVQASDLIEHIWSNEKMRYDSALARLYNLIANLRKLGLDDVIMHEKGGYHFNPECVVEVIK